MSNIWYELKCCIPGDKRDGVEWNSCKDNSADIRKKIYI